MSADEQKLSDRFYIAEGLRRPTLESIRDGAEVFVVAKIFEQGVNFLAGDPGIGVEIGRLGSQRSVTTVPLSSVTIAAGYCNADDLRYARTRLDVVEGVLAAIATIADEDPCPNWQDAVERIRAVLHSPCEEDDA